MSRKVDKIEIVDALAKTIKSPICPQATKAGMVATYPLALYEERVASRHALPPPGSSPCSSRPL